MMIETIVKHWADFLLIALVLTAIEINRVVDGGIGGGILFGLTAGIIGIVIERKFSGKKVKS